MRIPSRLRPILLAALVLALAAPALVPSALAMHPHPRESWTVGMGLGYSDGNFEFGPDLDLDGGRSSTGISPQVRFGRMLGQNFSIGLNYEGWVIEGGEIQPDVEERLRLSLQGVSLGLTWYPGNPHTAAGGFFLRGGAGLGWGRLVYSTVEPDFEHEQEAAVNETGLVLNAAIGYEFRVSRHFAFGASVNGNYLDIGKDIYDRGWFFPATMNLNWYW